MNVSKQEMNHALCNAVAARDVNFILQLLEYDTDQAFSFKQPDDQHSDQLIHLAVEAELHGLVRFLLAECKVDVNSLGFSARTPLHIAANCAYLKLAKLLIEFAAVIEARCASGLTPLMVTQHSRCSGANDVADLLLAHGAKLDIYSALSLGRIDDAHQLLASDAECVQDLPVIQSVSAAIRTEQTGLLYSMLENGLVITSDTFKWFTRCTGPASLEAIRIFAKYVNAPNCKLNGKEMLELAIGAGNVPAECILRELMDKRT